MSSGELRSVFGVVCLSLVTSGLLWLDRSTVCDKSLSFSALKVLAQTYTLSNTFCFRALTLSKCHHYSVGPDINGHRGQMHFGAAITPHEVHFLLARSDSIFSESVWGPWNTSLTVACPIKVKWLQRDSLATSKLFFRISPSSFVSVSIQMFVPGQTTTMKSHHLFIKKRWGLIASREDMLHWLLNKLLKDTTLSRPVCTHSELFPCVMTIEEASSITGKFSGKQVYNWVLWKGRKEAHKDWSGGKDEERKVEQKQKEWKSEEEEKLGWEGKQRKQKEKRVYWC